MPNPDYRKPRILYTTGSTSGILLATFRKSRDVQKIYLGERPRRLRTRVVEKVEARF